MRLIEKFLFPVALLRLNFGNGGSSSQESHTSTTSNTAITDRRTVADGGAVVVGDGSVATVNQTMTDFGSVQAGLNLAEKAVLGASKIATEANAASSGITRAALTSVKDAYETATKSAQDTASGNKTLAI